MNTLKCSKESYDKARLFAEGLIQEAVDADQLNDIRAHIEKNNFEAVIEWMENEFDVVGAGPKYLFNFFAVEIINLNEEISCWTENYHQEQKDAFPFKYADDEHRHFDNLEQR